MHEQPQYPGQPYQPAPGQHYQQPPAYANGYPPPPAVYQQPPAMAAPAPHRQVTRRPLSPMEHMFHAFMTLCTAGLWAFVWWSRVRSRRTVTTWD